MGNYKKFIIILIVLFVIIYGFVLFFSLRDTGVNKEINKEINLNNVIEDNIVVEDIKIPDDYVTNEDIEAAVDNIGILPEEYLDNLIKLNPNLGIEKEGVSYYSPEIINIMEESVAESDPNFQGWNNDYDF